MKKTILNIYRGVLFELDRYGAPTFNPVHFNYFFERSVQDWINKQYNVFDTRQQSIDNINVLVRTVTIANDDLPTDYYHLLNCFVTFKYTRNFGCHKKDDEFIRKVPRVTADKLVTIHENAYTKPSIRQVYHKIENNKIKLLWGTETLYSVVSTKIEYLCKVTIPVLTKTMLEADNTGTTPFPEYVDLELIKQCTTLFLENTNNPRVKDYIPVSTSIS